MSPVSAAPRSGETVLRDVPPHGAPGYGSGVTGEGSRRRLHAASRSFAASAENPAVRRIQLGFAGACTAEWAFTVVLSVYAYRQGGATAVGVVSLLRMLPSAVLAPLASAVADRWRRDLVLTLVSSTRSLTAVAMALLVATGGPPVAVYAVAMISTAAALLYRPVNSALLPLLCRTPGELASANVVRGLLDSLSTLVGPVIAAALLAQGGTSAGFVAVAVLSGLSAWLTIGLTVEEPGRRTPPSSVARGVVVAARVVWSTSSLRLLFLLLAVQTLTRGAVTVLTVLVAVDLLHLGDPGV